MQYTGLAMVGGTGGQRSLAAAVHRKTRHFTAPTGVEALQTSKRASPGVLTPPITCIVATPYLGVYAHRYGHILCVECEFACTIPISEVPNLGANTHPRWRAVLRHRGVCRSVRSKNTTPASGVWHSYRGFFALRLPNGRYARRAVPFFCEQRLLAGRLSFVLHLDPPCLLVSLRPL